MEKLLPCTEDLSVLASCRKPRRWGGPLLRKPGPGPRGCMLVRPNVVGPADTGSSNRCHRRRAGEARDFSGARNRGDDPQAIERRTGLVVLHQDADRLVAPRQLLRPAGDTA